MNLGTARIVHGNARRLGAVNRLLKHAILVESAPEGLPLHALIFGPKDAESPVVVPLPHEHDSSVELIDLPNQEGSHQCVQPQTPLGANHDVGRPSGLTLRYEKAKGAGAIWFVAGGLTPSARADLLGVHLRRHDRHHKKATT